MILDPRDALGHGDCPLTGCAATAYLHDTATVSDYGLTGQLVECPEDGQMLVLDEAATKVVNLDGEPLTDAARTDAAVIAALVDATIDAAEFATKAALR